jgi:primosomal protein N' (replication factor Y)
VFSTDLVEAIRARIARAEQTILFLNRRGYATSLTCPKCGYTANCGQCSVSCTYHRNDEKLRCHICGMEAPVPARCPECADPAFKFAGIGTQRVEGILNKLFPHAVVQRMDSDVTKTKDSYDRILGDFRVGKTHILIGTQMIAKGLHFPNVTLVGVIYADLSLHVPDFRAGERTFQLLAQVAGRAGRGDVSGEVIVQTYTPHHWAIQAARRLDYEGLCDQELAFREELKYPPFSHMVCITLKGPSEKKTEFTAKALADGLKAAVSNRVTVADASPAPLAKAKGQYRYHVIARARVASAITQPLKQLLKQFRCPQDVRCAVDVDALNLM